MIAHVVCRKDGAEDGDGASDRSVPGYVLRLGLDIPEVANRNSRSCCTGPHGPPPHN